MPEAELGTEPLLDSARRNESLLFARLAAYEIAEDPRLLNPELAETLDVLLEGSYESLFAAAVDRLASLDDRGIAPCSELLHRLLIPVYLRPTGFGLPFAASAPAASSPPSPDQTLQVHGHLRTPHGRNRFAAFWTGRHPI